MYKNIKFFEGLNALRFIAAFLVVIHHAEQIRLKYQLFNLKAFSIFNNGNIAVTFFFVLSGFLITYLLLKERTATRTISVKSFYLRRVLRIWPLYFLLVLIGTIIIPAFIEVIDQPYEMPYQFKDVILYYLFFTPFMVNIIYGHHLLEPLWSIGVEELFYIVWAPLMKYVKKNILLLILIVIILKIALITLSFFIPFSDIIRSILYILQFEAMAIGGLGAYLIYNCKKELSSMFLFSHTIQLTVFLCLIARVTCYNYLCEYSTFFQSLFNTPILSSLLLMGAFIYLIINISINKKSLISLNSKLMNWLGEISYGIYMYHMLVIFGIILFLSKTLKELSPFYSTLSFYTLLITLVVVIAFLSKTLFEDKFLRYKSCFQPKSSVKVLATSRLTNYSK